METKKRHWTMRIAVTGLMAFVIGVGWNVASGVLWQAGDASKMVPENTFLVLQYDGTREDFEAYQQTAEYAAFHHSGLVDLIDRTLDFLVAKDETGNAVKIRDAFGDLMGDGCLFAASLPEEGMPIPSVRFIFNTGGRWNATAVKLVQQILEEQGLELESRRVGRRQIASFLIPDSPGVEVGMWKEGNSMVLVAGINAVQDTLDCLAGDLPTLADNPNWKTLQEEEIDFTQTAMFWLDWDMLEATYGPLPIPLPTEEPMTVADILKLTQLDQLESIISQSGYRGKALWSETLIRGMNQTEMPMMTLDDLPPLPSRSNWFSALQCDPANFYEQLISTMQQASAFAPPEEQEQMQARLDELVEMLGFDPQSDFFDHLGNLICVYDDANGGMFGMGTTICISLKDAAKIEEFIDTQMSRLEQAQEDGEYFEWPVYPYRIEQDGQSLIVFDIYSGLDDSAYQFGAIQVVEDWLVIGMMPQSIQAFELRLEGVLPQWQPNEEYQEALADLPKEFTSITSINTRDTYQLVLNLATPFLPVLQQLMMDQVLEDEEELPFYLEEFPPSELITYPLFPNIAMTVNDPEGTRYIMRNSTIGFPMAGGSGNVGTAGVAAMSVALLLPAVQSARFAARDAQSKNNMKQLGLAMHNYHDVYGHFPAGTVANDRLKPSERLSWTTSVLPFIEQAALFEELDQDAKWDEGINGELSQMMIPVFLDPNQEPFNYLEDGDYMTIHYAGIAGVGKKAPMLKIGQPGCGIFGYDRQTRMRDITDGTSNTMAITQINDDFGPWSRGGTSTIRSLTQQPYVNGPDGIGGSQGDTVQVLFADGSVRTISAEVDPKIMENLAEMADGNVVPNF